VKLALFKAYRVSMPIDGCRRRRLSRFSIQRPHGSSAASLGRPVVMVVELGLDGGPEPLRRRRYPSTPRCGPWTAAAPIRLRRHRSGPRCTGSRQITLLGNSPRRVTATTRHAQPTRPSTAGESDPPRQPAPAHCHVYRRGSMRKSLQRMDIRQRHLLDDDHTLLPGRTPQHHRISRLRASDGGHGKLPGGGHETARWRS